MIRLAAFRGVHSGQRATMSLARRPSAGASPASLCSENALEVPPRPRPRHSGQFCAWVGKASPDSVATHAALGEKMMAESTPILVP